MNIRVNLIGLIDGTGCIVGRFWVPFESLIWCVLFELDSDLNVVKDGLWTKKLLIEIILDQSLCDGKGNRYKFDEFL